MATTFESLAPTYYISFVYGLIIPWGGSASRTTRMVNWTLKGLNALSMTLYLLSTSFSGLTVEMSISTYLQIINVFGYAFIDIVVLVLCALSRKQIQGIFHSLEAIDRLLVQVNIQVNHQKIRRVNWTIVVLFFGVNFLHIGTVLLTRPLEVVFSPWPMYSLFFKQFCHQAYALLLVTIVNSVHQRLVALNEGMDLICSRRFLEGNYSVTGLMFLTGVVRRPTKDTLCRLGRIHQRLCDLLPSTGNAFGLQTTLYVALYLSVILFLMYQAMDDHGDVFQRIFRLCQVFGHRGPQGSQWEQKLQAKKGIRLFFPANLSLRREDQIRRSGVQLAVHFFGKESPWLSQQIEIISYVTGLWSVHDIPVGFNAIQPPCCFEKE